MNIGIFFSDIRPFLSDGESRYDLTFSRLREHGILGLQLRDAEIYEEGEERLLRAMNRYGLHTEVIHVCIPLMTADHAVFDTAVQYARYTFDLMRRLGCHRLMVVPRPKTDVKDPADRLRAQQAMLEGFRRICKSAPDGIEILAENYSHSTVPFSTVEDMEKLLAAAPESRYIFDTGNFFCVNESPRSAYLRLKESLSAVHVKNCDFSEKGVLVDKGKHMITLPFRRDTMHLGDLLRQMHRDGIDVPLIMEHNPNTSWEEILDNAAFLCEIFN